MFNLEEKLPLLKDYFAKQPEIIMAFVFGSTVRGQETQESDVDIAVYFKPVGRSLEWEEQYEYVRENEIWGEVEKIVGKRTDLVILNRAPSTLAYSVLQGGKVIVVKDVGLYWKFFLLI
ncbi:MAG: nucleotidyltransferase domain-containing protein, partial [Candidatus Vogelbacteria bacterium]|nr:nucleotidyltransferase domain-containing protein [Candidatus Vogelbacteria bacterium]